MSLLESMGVTEYQEKRRNAVADNLSRLAFVTSDIVIFIWNGKLVPHPSNCDLLLTYSCFKNPFRMQVI